MSRKKNSGSVMGANQETGAAPQQQRDIANALEGITFSAPGVKLDERTSRSLQQQQILALGVPAADVPEAELARGQQIDARVTEQQLNTVIAHYAAAQLNFLDALQDRTYEPPAKVLLGPTSRVVDHVLRGDGLQYLAGRLLKEGKEEELRRAINDGPGGGEAVWERPGTPVETVASIIRWAYLRGADKKRIRTDDQIRKWMSETMEQAGYDTRPRLGGVIAVGTALTAVLGRSPTMFALGTLPADIIKHLNPQTEVVGDDPAVRTLIDLPRSSAAAGNFAISCSGGPLPLPAGLESFLVNGQTAGAQDISSFDILVVGAKSPAGFGGVTIDRMRALGREHSLMVLTGVQSLADDRESKAFFDHVQASHDEGTAMALLYSESKVPEREVDVWREIRERRCIEYLGINAAETYDFLARIAADSRGENRLGLAPAVIDSLQEALRIGASDGGVWKSGREVPAWLFRSAVLLQDILEIPVVRVRGKFCDVLLAAPDVKGVAPHSVKNNMIISRNMGTLKTANVTGLIDQPGELGVLRNVPAGPTLAALQLLGDQAAMFGAENQQLGWSFRPSHLPHTLWTRLADRRYCFAVPPIDFYDRSGGTQSAGDTIDVTFVTEEMNGLMACALQANKLRARR